MHNWDAARGCRTKKKEKLNLKKEERMDFSLLASLREKGDALSNYFHGFFYINYIWIIMGIMVNELLPTSLVR